MRRLHIIDWALLLGLLLASAGLAWALLNNSTLAGTGRDYAGELSAKLHRPVSEAMCQPRELRGVPILLCRAVMTITIDGRTRQLPFTGALPR